MRHNEKAKIGGNDETLSNFIKESTREGERKRNKEQGPKFWQAKEPQRDEPHGGKGKTKCQNYHQSHEAYQRGGRPDKTSSFRRILPCNNSLPLNEGGLCSL